MCTACESAKQNPRTAIYCSGCISCSARMLAQSQQYQESASKNRMTPGYRSAIGAAFDDPAAGHQLVKQWAERIAGEQV